MNLRTDMNAFREELEKAIAPDEIRLLASVGFMAARSGLVEQACVIFESLALIRPKAPFPYVGLAVSNLCVGRAERAVELLQNLALIEFPDELELRLWLAIALHYSGQSAKATDSLRYLVRSDINSVGLHALENILRNIVNTEPMSLCFGKNIVDKAGALSTEV